MLKNIKNTIIKRVSSRHVAGPKMDDAIRVCRWALKNDFNLALAPWRETGEAKESLFESYKSVIQFLKDDNIDGYLSIKLDAIDYDFGKFRELLDLGRFHNIRIHVDSLDPESAPKTHQFLERASEYHQVLGCTLPSRWKRSLNDCERVVSLGISVRIVKGQWEDNKYNDVDCRNNYMSIIGKLAGRARHVGIATHDVKLAEKALKGLIASKTHCEMEQFFSLPLNGRAIAKNLGCPYRLYVSYGQPGIPYNIRFASTRPSIAAWMMADFAFNFKKPWDKNLT